MDKKLYDLTAPQKSIWLTEQYYQNTNINNVCGTFLSTVPLDFSILEKSIRVFVKNNASFKIKLTLIDGVIKQYFDNDFDFNIDTFCINSDEDRINLEKTVNANGFELLESLLFKFVLFKYPDNHGGFIINANHIISDSWTSGIIANEISTIYTALISGQSFSKDPDLSYLNYIQAEQEYLKSEKFKKDKSYWDEIFTEIPEVATIPSLNRDLSTTDLSVKANRYLVNLSTEKFEELKKYTLQNKISIYNLFMGVFALYLGRVSNLDDFAIGTPILNRTNFKEKQTTGMFINVLPLKFHIDHKKKFTEFISETAINSLGLLRHQRYSYNYILEDLRKKDASLPGLYNVLFSYQITKMNENNDSLPHRTSWIFNESTLNDLDIHIFEWNDSNTLQIAYDYKADKYSEKEISAMHERILHVLDQVISDEEILMKEIEIVTEKEKYQILYEFNNTKADYPKDKTIAQLFEEQVEKTPDNIAVVFEDQKLTYRELNEKANQLANYLRNNGIGRNDIIGIMVSRSLEMIIGILAILKSGGTYIPIDPEYPQDRIEYMLKNSMTKTLLTFRNLENKISFDNKFFIELHNNNIYTLDNKNLKCTNTPDDLAYIIYTSGSTGKPKGVMLKHSSLLNLTNYCNKNIEYLKDGLYRTIVSITTISFDIFIFETLISLQRGLRLVIANDNEQHIPIHLDKLIKSENIEIIQATPSRMKIFYDNIHIMPNFSNLKYIMLAGEHLPLSLAKKLVNCIDCKIYNGYGPSETTVFSTITNVTNKEKITIGKPLDNTQIYILNHNNLSPVNVPGEIYISGSGVGNGYINNNILTLKSFISNPFIPNSIMYRTGDLGYYNENGEIICLGRADSQVKIRGLRIELEEIEKSILSINGITNCVLVKRSNANSREFLCAYFMQSKPVDISNIKSTLQKRLPEYMVPQYFIELKGFPYTPNGKIDKKALPDFNMENKKGIIPPRNSIDTILIDILKKLLDLKNISIDDSLYDLGSDSLTAINLSIQIYNQFNVSLPIKNILKNSTIRNLSDYISLAEKECTRTSFHKVKKQNLYSTSSAQKNMYYSIELAGKGSMLYNIPCGVIFNKLPDVKNLETCFYELILRHESFRTYFEIEEDIIVQKILDTVDFHLETNNTTISLKDLDLEFKDFVKSFDLSKAPLLRAKLLKIDNGKAVLFVDMHHIISDGTSLSIFINELCKLYNNETLEPIEFTYKDFAYWENEALSSGKFKESEDFWVNQFKNDIPVLNMPTNYTRPAVKSYEGSKVYSNIDSETLNKIHTICKELSITPYMLLLATYYILLSKYTGQDDIVVGSPIVGRNFSELYNIIGMFVNTLPVRAKIDSALTFKEFLNTIKDICLENYKYQDYPLNELIKKLNIQRDTSRAPLFDTLFTYQNNGLTSVHFNGIHSEFYIPDTKISKFDLSLEIVPQDDILNLNFEYCTKLFTKQFIENFATHYKNILNTILDNLDVQISSICMLSEKEKHKILYEFNNTKADYPKDKTISQLFEEQVEKTPNNIAVVFEDQKLTYKELNKKANQLANYLISCGIEKNKPIAVLLDRSIDLIISMLAIIKSGAIYLPLSIEFPMDRINYILNNSKASFIITESVNTLTTNNNLKIININEISFENIKSLNLSIDIKPNNGLYIIYTSGSTGNPKGVEVSHRNLNNFIHSFNYLFKNISSNDRLLASTNICFDVSIFEFFISLLNGVSLYLYNENTISDIFKFCNKIIENEITMLYFPPNILENIYDILYNFKYTKLSKILVGVEPIKSSTIKKFFTLNPELNIINAYGPTETTICSTAINISKEVLNKYKIIPIGKPIHNLNLFILDKHLNHLPINVPGELYISGDNVSNGYYNNSPLTNTSFINLNFTSQKVYKTGDIVKWNEDGTISFIGRDDFQIKINGHRIELGEIESCIYEFENIKKCLAIVKNNKIIVYFTSNKQVDLKELKEFLKLKLPIYYIPHFFVQIDNFKLTANGKIDTKILPEITDIDTTKNIIKPRNSIDSNLIEIMETILNIKNISIDDSFFDLGGDSLNAINLCTQIYRKLNIQISAKDIFEKPIISDLSDYLSSRLSANTNHLTHIQLANYYPISSSQENTYIASEMSEKDSVLYNISGGIIFDKLPDIKKLETCFNELILRHESFRTYFEIEEDIIVQKILDTVDFHLETNNTTISLKDLDLEFKDFVKSFDLSKAPLLRAKLLKIDNGKAVLFVDMHHIISDGTSLSIFINELCKLYNNETLEPIEFTYKDFAYWENEALSSEKLKEAEDFWVNQFKNDIPVLNMPTNYTRPAVKSYEGSKVYSNIDSETLNKIHTICKKLSITPYMLLLATYYILLSKYTGQDDIIVGSPIVGRNFSELYNIIGMFVNTLPVRAKIDSALTFKEFLNTIKDICLENYKYQDYPLNELIKKLNIQRDTSRAPLFDTLFTYQNNGLTSVHFNGIHSEFYIPDTKISKFDLSLEIVPQDNILNLNFEYCTKLFTKQFIENFANHYKNILTTVLDNLDVQISSICMLSEKEKHKILYEFNNTKADYPKDKTISQLFEEQVEKTPDNIAVVFEDQKLTYRELNKKANSLAHYLRNNGINRNDIVGIMVNRSLEMIICILAVLKSGGTYIPIDPEYPQDRTQYMLKNSNAKLLLTFKNLENKLPFENKVFVELTNQALYSLDNTDLENINEPEDSCYVIYTSGSTGLPKGVVLKHRNIVNFIFGLINKIPITSEDVIVSITTISFDIFVLESLLPLLNGVKIVLASEKAQTDISLLNKICIENNVSIIQTTPSRMLSYTLDNNISKFIEKIKIFLIGGEPFNKLLLENLHMQSNGKIFNMYGPTETAVWSSIKELSHTDQITIGTPISNTQMYILDSHLQPCPIGIPGELYIAGDGVSKGYLNDEEKTKNSFIPNPFIPNTIMYKTGDLCKYLPTGGIEYLERVDNQVKIRGLRIELGEIENQMIRFPNIKKACVIKQTINNRDFISAYFTITKRIHISELRKYLSNYVPKYMVPSYFTVLDDFLYTPNGKINKKALPLPKEILSTSSEKYVAPKTDLQIKLVNIFEQVLNTTPIGINDNFFELGGDSILAMNLNIELKKITDKISYADIFKFPTISALESKLNSNEEDYDFQYMEKNYDKYTKLLNQNYKIPELYDLNYTEPGNILLTGATGFLGMHILEAFIKNEKGIVYCIVRNEPGLTAKLKLQQKLHYYFGDKYDKLIGKRIFAITGDICVPGFGLAQEELLKLSNNIDIVINSAAKVSHYGNYTDFYNINVKSVKYMLDFCKSFHKKFYQISTLSVSGNSLESSSVKQNMSEETIFAENNLYIGQSLENVYVRSKFEAECLVLDAVLDGLDAYILRVGNLMPRFRDGVFQENISENAYINRIVSFIKIGSIPDYMKDSYLEFTPIDTVANAISKLVTYPNNDNRIFHLFNHHHVYLKTVFKYLEQLNENFEIVEEETFKKKIRKMINNINQKEFLNSLMNDFDRDLHLVYNTDIIIKSENTIGYLEKIGFSWPNITERYLNKFINLLRMVL